MASAQSRYAESATRTTDGRLTAQAPDYPDGEKSGNLHRLSGAAILKGAKGAHMALKFDGALNKHREPRIIGLLMSEGDIQENSAKWAEEDKQNLFALCEYFGISEGPDQFYFLALALAREVVPCFQAKTKEGRPRKWDDYSRGVLAVEIERITSTGMSLNDATKEIATRPPWKSFLEKWDDDKSLGADPAEALKTAYKSAKKSYFLSVARDAFKFHEMSGTIREWESLVLSLKGNN